MTLTDEQRDPLTSNLLMLMVLTLLIVSQAPHSCQISSMDARFLGIFSNSLLDATYYLFPCQAWTVTFFTLIAFQNLQTVSYPHWHFQVIHPVLYGFVFQERMVFLVDQVRNPLCIRKGQFGLIRVYLSLAYQNQVHGLLCDWFHNPLLEGMQFML